MEALALKPSHLDERLRAQCVSLGRRNEVQRRVPTLTHGIQVGALWLGVGLG